MNVEEERERERPRRNWESKSDILLCEMPYKSRKEWGFGSAVLGHSLNEDFAFSHSEREKKQRGKTPQIENRTKQQHEVYITSKWILKLLT